MKTIIGIDIGGSTTKIVGVRDGKIINPLKVKADDPVTSAYGAFGRFLAENHMTVEQIDKVMFTGVGSSFITSSGMYGVPIQKVDEFTAIGKGGCTITGLDRCIIVSMGTGTAFVRVKDGAAQHLGGTGVGGGTLLGLCGKMLGLHSVDHIMELAEQGDLSNVDLTIGDISDVPLSNMSAEITASNFGKVSDMATNGDIALGVLNLVFQTVGMLAVFSTREEGIKNVVLTGNLTKIPMAKKLFLQMEELYDIRFIIPENADYATAIGAAMLGIA